MGQESFIEASSQSDYVQLFLPGQHCARPGRELRWYRCLFLSLTAITNGKQKRKNGRRACRRAQGKLLIIQTRTRKSHAFSHNSGCSFGFRFWGVTSVGLQSRTLLLSLSSKGKFNYAVAVIVYAALAAARCCLYSLVL